MFKASTFCWVIFGLIGVAFVSTLFGFPVPFEICAGAAILLIGIANCK